jgi:hypothetical protein
MMNNKANSDVLYLKNKEKIMKKIGKWQVLTGIILVLAFAAPSFAEDPVPVYETTISGYYLASGQGVVVDNDGNAYVIGKEYEDHTHLDILIVKLDPGGNLIWTRLIVGDERQHDYATDLALDSENNVWVTGWTSSESFPVTPNALDNTLTGFTDVFLLKLSSEDGEILYGTFLGGDYDDRGESIAINDAGEIYLSGYTKSTDFPTVNAYQDHPSAPLYVYQDAFITKLTAAGDSILYSTYFGGYKNDVAENIALDSQGNIIIAGQTNADDFPLVNPIQSEPNGLFVSKLSPDGSTLEFSTYLGGEDSDRLGGMVIDSDDNVYLAGSTRSINFPTTRGAYQEEFVGEILGCEIPFGGRYNCDDVFATKLDTDGGGLLYSTYLGGSHIEECRDIAVDDRGRAHVVGYTNSMDFPPNGIDFSAEIFVSRFSATGSNLDYSYTVNSGSANAGHGVALDHSGNVYFTGAINVPADLYVSKLTVEEPIPDIALTISSLTGEVRPNSYFRFDVQVTNNDSIPRTIEGWTAVRRLPDGPIFQPLIGPATMMLDPGETRTFRNIRQWVGNAPLGDYRYYARAGGNFPEPLWAEDYWDLTVIESAPLSVTGDVQSSGFATDPGGFDNNEFDSKGVLSGRDNPSDLPGSTVLLGNYPNPFNAETNIKFYSGINGHVRLEIYNLVGQKVETLLNGYMNAGYHTLNWDASVYSSGVYFYRLIVGNYVETKKMYLVK